MADIGRSCSFDAGIVSDRRQNDLILGYCARAMLKRGADHVMVALLKLFEASHASSLSVFR